MGGAYCSATTPGSEFPGSTKIGGLRNAETLPPANDNVVTLHHKTAVALGADEPIAAPRRSGLLIVI
jgi:hypothetical protein